MIDRRSSKGVCSIVLIATVSIGLKKSCILTIRIPKIARPRKTSSTRIRSCAETGEAMVFMLGLLYGLCKTAQECICRTSRMCSLLR